MKRSHFFLKLALVATGLLGLAPQVFAAGTAAGTTVSNTASVVYDVALVTQPAVSSNAATFLVDRRINLTVAEVGGAATTTVPGSTAQVLTFTVTNTSNATLDFRLTATQDATGTPAPFGAVNDSFDVTAIPPPGVFAESGVTPGYQPLEDTATFIDELGADLARTAYIVSTIPATAINGDVASLTLTAFAAQDATTSGTGAYTPTPGALAADAAQTNTAVIDDPNFTDTVFGDVAGDTDALRDGRHSDDDQYNVVTAAIVVVKSSSVVSDPFNGVANPKAIPGAVIEYCLDVNNTGAAAATSIVMTDGVPANTTYVPGSIKSAATGVGTACDVGSGTVEDDDNAGADETDVNGGDFAFTTLGAVTVRAPTIAAGARFKATFRVTVN